MGASLRTHEPLPRDALRVAADTFGLLAAPSRLQIVWLLSGGELDVGTLAVLVGGSVQAVSQHLAKLKAAGLVRARRQGRHQLYRVDNKTIAAVVRQVIEGSAP